MPVTVHALSSFMMFPASNAHACTVPAAAVPAVQREREAPGVSVAGQSRRLIAAESSDFSHVSFFGFLRRNINYEKRQGVSYWSEHAYAAGVPTVLVTTGHQIDGATVRQRACPATKPRTCRTRCRQEGIVRRRLLQRRLLHRSQARAIRKDRQNTAPHWYCRGFDGQSGRHVSNTMSSSEP